jgi:hypothetical protein
VPQAIQMNPSTNHTRHPDSSQFALAAELAEIGDPATKLKDTSINSLVPQSHPALELISADNCCLYDYLGRGLRRAKMFRLLVLVAAVCSVVSAQQINFGFTTGTRSLWVSFHVFWMALEFQDSSGLVLERCPMIKEMC